MKTRTWLLISLVLNAGLLGGLGFLAKQAPRDAETTLPQADGQNRVAIAAAQQAVGPHFGPVYEIVLPSAPRDQRPELFDIEKGRRLYEPDFATFNNDARAAVSWITSSGLDLCTLSAQGTMPCCVSYYMAVVPCAANLWDSITASEVLTSETLAQIKDPKRHCLFPKPESISTCYMFRTREGAHGLLSIQKTDNAMRIRYKLALQPAQTEEMQFTAK